MLSKIMLIIQYDHYTLIQKVSIANKDFVNLLHMTYNHGKKLMAKRQKTPLCLTPQAMYNQFKRPSAGSVSELYYICRKT